MKKIITAVCFVLASSSFANAQQDDYLEYEERYRQRLDREFYEESDGMKEAVKYMGFSNEDNKAMMRHVIDNGGRMTADSLRESDMTYEAWEQFRDDARYEE